MNCTKCNVPLGAYFKIERIGRDGAVTTSATLCSLQCLLGWGQDFAANAGIQIAIGVQQKIESAKRTWDAVKQFIKGS
jgi:hypothetical protein